MPRPPIPREPLDGRAQFTTPPAHTAPAFIASPSPGRRPMPHCSRSLRCLARLFPLDIERPGTSGGGRRGLHWRPPRSRCPALHIFKVYTSPTPSDLLPSTPPSSPPQPAKKKTAASGPSYVSQAKGAIIAIADRTGSSLQAIKVRFEVKKKGVCVVCCVWGVLSVCRAGGRRAGGSCV